MSKYIYIFVKNCKEIALINYRRISQELTEPQTNELSGEAYDEEGNIRLWLVIRAFDTIRKNGKNDFIKNMTAEIIKLVDYLGLSEPIKVESDKVISD